MSSTGEPVAVADWGRLDYRTAWSRQLELVDQRKVGDGIDTFAFVEHDHVITVGRTQKALGNILAAGDVEVVEVERGGDVTYHGPGQIVVYPVLALSGSERDLHAFLRNLEQAMIDTCARFDLSAGREPGKTGVWIGARKIASIGIACRRWVTFHGLALNVSTDLSYFARINPCGFDASIMTSMSAELDGAIDIAAVKPVLAEQLAASLSRTLA